MLVLSRRAGERLLLSNGVVVHVVAVRRHHGHLRVTLGVDAPGDVAISRGEKADAAEVARIEALARTGREGVADGR